MSPKDITPSVSEIRWETTPDALMEIAERHRDALEPALRDLQRAYEHRSATLTPEETNRRAQVSLSRFRGNR